MNGEFSLDVKKIAFSTDFDMSQPYSDTIDGHAIPYIDLDIFTQDGTFHICGRNDWAYLVTDALIPFLRYAKSVEKYVDDEIRKTARYKTDVICVGRNQFRAMDIMHQLRNGGEHIKTYRSIPVVKLKENDGVRIYSSNKDEEHEEPFI